MRTHCATEWMDRFVMFTVQSFNWLQTLTVIWHQRQCSPVIPLYDLICFRHLLHFPVQLPSVQWWRKVYHCKRLWEWNKTIVIESWNLFVRLIANLWRFLRLGICADAWSWCMLNASFMNGILADFGYNNLLCQHETILSWLSKLLTHTAETLLSQTNQHV